jgi:hypothetical protein
MTPRVPRVRGAGHFLNPVPGPTFDFYQSAAFFTGGDPDIRTFKYGVFLQVLDPCSGPVVAEPGFVRLNGRSDFSYPRPDRPVSGVSAQAGPGKDLGHRETGGRSHHPLRAAPARCLFGGLCWCTQVHHSDLPWRDENTPLRCPCHCRTVERMEGFTA